MTKQNESYYSRLKVYKNRRFWLICFCLILIALGIIGLSLAELEEHSKTTVVLALAALSCLLVFMPPSEEWDYQPWQAEAKLVEKDLDRR